MLGENQRAAIDHAFDDWPTGYYYKWLSEITEMPKENLLNTFNCGVGMVIAVSESDEEDALGALNQSLFAKKIGVIEEKKENEPAIAFV